MNEQDHDLRFALRNLRQDATPERDLWPGIAAQMEGRPRQAAAPRRDARLRRRWQPLAMVAALALVAVLGMRMKTGLDTPQPSVAPTHAPLRVAAVRMTRDYQIALEQMQGAPVPVALVPALDDLDKSAGQILQAIDSDPRSPQLLQTLRYTYDRRLALTRRAALS